MRALVVFALLGLAAAAAVAAAPSPLSFIRPSGLTFVDGDCHEFAFSGWNTFQAVDAAAEACCGGLKQVQAQFAKGASYNLTVARVFAFPVKEGLDLQTAPGVFNEKMLAALDATLAAAAAAGVRVSLSLLNNWNYNDASKDTKCGIARMAKGSPKLTGAECDAAFWGNDAAKQIYKDYVKAIVTRTNSVTGVKYVDDGTIFAWGLINEPRCELKGCAPLMQAWIEEMAPYVKSLDARHMLTVGSDGFMQRANCQSELANPQRSRGRDGTGPEGVGWPLLTGQDFVPNHAIKDIDFLAFHMWADNWERPDLEFGRVWLREKVRNAAMLRKPLVLEEFGKAASGPFPQSTPAAQQEWYRTVYDAVATSMARGTGLAGVMFWRWAVVDSGADLGEFDRGSLITTDSKVFADIIAPFSADVAARDAKHVVKGCAKEGAATAAAPRKAGAKPADGGGVAAASAGGVEPTRRRLAGWADTSDIDVSALATQLPGGYRPAGLSGPWAGASSSQMKASWNPEFGGTTTATAPADEPPATPRATAKPAAPKPAATPAAAAKPAATPVAAANKTTAPAAALPANRTKPAVVAPPVAAAAAPAPADGGRAVSAVAEQRLIAPGATKVDMDALNRKVTC